MAGVRRSIRACCCGLARGSRGAATTLFIVITAGVLLLGAVLVDYARVAALNALADHAVRTSVRSVLSAYDASLYSRYGLFGRGGTAAEMIYERSLRGTLEYGGSDGRFRPVSPRVDGFTVDAADYLGRYGVLERQILEEMKIKAPVDFMMDIGTRFTAMSQVMKETTTTADALADVGKLYDQRQAHLQNALAKMREIAKAPAGSLSGDEAVALAAGYPAYAEQKAEAVRLAQAIAAAEASAASSGGSGTDSRSGGGNGSSSSGADNGNGAGANDSPSSASAEPDAASELKKQLAACQEQIAQYEASMRSLIAGLIGDSDAARTQLQLAQQAALLELAEAKRLNGEMKTAAARAEAASAPGYDRVSRQSAAAPAAEQARNGETLREIRRSADQLVLEESWFAAFLSELEQQGSGLLAVIEAANQFASAAQAALSGGSSNAASLTAGSASLKQAYLGFQQRYVLPGDVIKQRERLILASDAMDEQRKKDSAETAKVLGDVRGMLPAAAAASLPLDVRELYEQVGVRYEANRLFNAAADEAEEADENAAVAADSEEQREASSSMMGTLFNGLGDMLEGTRNSFYAGEYVMSRFRSYESQMKPAASGSGSPAQIGQAMAFFNQEAEYVLYGFNEPSANVAAALAEVFGVRFAIRLTEGFIECRAFGHPLVVLSGALLYAARNAYMDMQDLMRRGAAKLSKYAQADIKYSDYLRLFMLMHGGGGKRLSRIAAVIETNVGTDLSRTPAAVSATADISMKLLFLPGAMKLLGTFGILQGRVADGRYETTKLAGLSY